MEKLRLVAAVACATLDGPLAVSRGETLIVASSFEQSRIAFEFVLAYMGDKLQDRQKWRVWDSAQLARIEDRVTGARVRCLASDPRRVHGLAPTLSLMDEPAQWPTQIAERMLAAIRTAAGKQPHSRMVALGTRPADTEHFFSKMLDGGSEYAQTHAADVKDAPGWRRTWAKANPSMNHFPDLEVAIRREWKEAKRDPALMASFEALRLNLGTSDVRESLLLESDSWVAAEGHAEASGPVYFGIDLGGSAASSAIAAYWPRTGRLESVAAFPSIPDLRSRGLGDGVGRLYAESFKRGELLALGDHAVPVGELLAVAVARFGHPEAIACDRWRQGELLDAASEANVYAPVAWRGQGFKDGGEDVRTFRRAFAERAVIPVPSIFLASCVGQARTLTDPAGNAKLGKRSEGGRRTLARDDAAAAAILAVSLARRHNVKGEAAGVYFGRA